MDQQTLECYDGSDDGRFGAYESADVRQLHALLLDPGRSARCAYRLRYFPDFRFVDSGFRVVLSPFPGS